MIQRALAVTASIALTAALLGAPGAAHAFCGFYVTDASAPLYSNATQVVLMREGTRTILSMQNNYKGPPEDFALVVPVPIVLQQENVKTLDASLFAKVDTLSAPRLVEYWEQDPCAGHSGDQDLAYPESDGSVTDPTQVEVEAQFAVGEYDVVVLSASDASALESWLTSHDYNIPAGSAQYLDPYVQAGMYFFVAEVDTERVTMEEGRAVLSPLRFWYDAEDFALPIRLGLINAPDTQDLLVYTLGQGQRYDVANYPNAFIPTNIDVVDDVRYDFGAFYEALFAKTLEVHPGAVVTEYSWDGGSCDPCPGPQLDAEDYLTLGADVLPDQPTYGWVVTRLHARYTPDTLGEDLVFREAPAVLGGREYPDETGDLSQEPSSSEINNFQARYVIRHPWEGAALCFNPTWGVWGGPPGGGDVPAPAAAQSANTRGEEPGSDGGGEVSALVAEDVPSLGITAADGGSGGCGCGEDGASPTQAGISLLVTAAILRGIRRRRSPAERP